jgi:hypothetical protein
MKPFSRRQPLKPLSRSTARNSALINQFATPGLGSLLAGRYVAGVGQLLLALAGFGLILAWFAALMIGIYGEIQGNAPGKSVGWLGELGALTFGGAWVWALLTSLSILREARESEPKPPPPI